MVEVCDSMSEQCHQYSRGEKPTCSPNKAKLLLIQVTESIGERIHIRIYLSIFSRF